MASDPRCRVQPVGSGAGRGLFATEALAPGDTVLRVRRGDVFQEVFPDALALERALAAAPSVGIARELLEHTVPGLTGRF